MWGKIKKWFSIFDINKDNKVTAEDLRVAKEIAEKNIKEANEAINKAKKRVKRVKEELVDVNEAVKEVINQAGDVVDAAKGKSRAGRKKKS